VWRIASYIWYALPLCFLYKCILLIAIQLTSTTTSWPQRKSNSRMLLLWNCFAALQVHFMHLRSKGVPHDVGQQMHALFVSCAD